VKYGSLRTKTLYHELVATNSLVLVPHATGLAAPRQYAGNNSPAFYTVGEHMTLFGFAIQFAVVVSLELQHHSSSVSVL
jgi:hypothetical protein